MSGTLNINDRNVWMPNNWVYDSIIQTILDNPKGLTPNLLKLLREGKTDHLLYIDLSQISKQHYNSLFESINQINNKLRQTANKFPTETGDYFHLIFAYRELLLLMSDDSRIDNQNQEGGIIQFSISERWDAPWCIFDLVLDNLAASVYEQSPNLSSNLAKGKVSEKRGFVNLSNLDASKFMLLGWAIKWMHGFYGDGQGRMSKGTKIFQTMAPYINSLFDLYVSDKRYIL